MTERGRFDVCRDSHSLSIANSSMRWDASGLTIDIDETCVPFPKRIKGQIKLYPSAVQPTAFALDAAGDHTWQPIAPIADVEVTLATPGISWRGHGYFDHNAGTAPLEDTFKRWHWSRAAQDRAATIFYDVTPRAGNERCLALKIDAAGTARAIEMPPPVASVPGTAWRIARATRCDTGHAPRVSSTLEDTPFYARSIVASTIDGQRITSMHESLDLDRFGLPIVQAMLPFRMPRRARRTSPT